MKLRRYSPEDRETVLKLFYETVHSVNAADYTAEQLDAWAPIEADRAVWNNRLSGNYTVIAENSGVIIGFGSAEDTGCFDLLYIHKDYQRAGAASLIADDIERHFACVGITTIQTDASITARPFFEKRGYIVSAEQRVERRGQFFTNFKMQKLLNGNGANAL